DRVADGLLDDSAVTSYRRCHRFEVARHETVVRLGIELFSELCRVDEVDEDGRDVLPNIGYRRRRSAQDVAVAALVEVDASANDACGALADDDLSWLGEADESCSLGDGSADRRPAGPPDDHLAAFDCHPQRQRLGEGTHEAVVNRPCGLDG